MVIRKSLEPKGEVRRDIYKAACEQKDGVTDLES
jgi:hypothetical protein